MKKYFSFLVLAVCIKFSVTAQTGTSTNYSFTSGGNTRSYRVYVPASYDGSRPVPLMLNIHGFTLTMQNEEEYMDFRPVADTAGFITVAPQGISNDWSQSGTVAAGQADRDFLWAMIDSIKAHYNINPCKIYTSGYSKGGFMSYILCLNEDSPTRAPVIAAMASVCGGISDNQTTNGYWRNKNPTHPTPVMEIHGTNDGTIGYTGNTLGQGQVHVDTLMKYWVNFNQCNPTPTQTNFDNVTESTSSTVQHYVWSGGLRGSSVELYKIINGGHTVPQNPAPTNQRGNGNQNQDFNSAQVIWQFCSKYCLPYLTSQTCTSVPTISVQPTSKTVCSGDNVTFPISATGCVGTALTYQWQANTGGGFSNISNSAPYSGVTTPSLTVSSATTVLSGNKYRCIVTSCCDVATSSTATLTVNNCSALSATISGNSTVCEGDASPNILFTGSNGTTPYTFTYSINGGATQTVSSTGGNSTVSIAAPTGMAGTFTYSLISVQDATPTTASASGSVTVVVNGLPTINGVTGASRCDAGTLVLSASASAGTVNWYDASTNGNLLYTGTTYTTQVISNTTPYYAEATNNGCISSVRSTVTATVYTTPAVPTAGSNSPVCEGGMINLTASTTTIGTIVYDWVGSDSFSASNTQNPSDSGFPTLIAGLYSFSVTATQNGCTSSVGTTTVVVQAGAIPSVSISVSSGSNTICSGQTVSLTAAPTNGGSTPTYQWVINGQNINGANSDSYSSAAFNDSDMISCILNSNAACVNPSTVASNTITMSVTSTLTPAVSIAITSGSNPTCGGQSLTFSATPSNGGASPSYEWKVNGITVGGVSDTYTASNWNDNDEIYCILTSSSNCANPTTANSNSVTVSIATSLTPAVSVAVTLGSNPTCSGQNIGFTATPTNGGTIPTYQWYVNGSPVVGSGDTYSSSSLNDNDIVSCVLTSNDPCANPVTASSNSVTVTITTLTPAVSVAVTSGGNPTCSGQNVGFTASPTNGGSAPSYQWYVNGNTVVGSGDTYASSGLNDNDVVSCVLTSNDACASPTTATSNSVTITVTTSLVPSVSISQTSGSNPTCAGQTLGFTATPVNGGSAPVYQWQVNGNGVNGANTNTVAIASLSNNDVVSCILASNNACAIPTTASSNSLSVVVTNTVSPSITVNIANGGINTICSGQSVTFTASTTNGGITPAYQWLLNNSPVGINSNTYINAGLGNSDKVSCVLTSNANCVTPATAISNTITMVIASSSTPTVSIAITSGTNPAVAGQTVGFAATSSSLGTYQWKMNSVNAGNGGMSFSSSGFSDGDIVTTVLTSTNSCGNSSVVVSNAITMTVVPQGVLSVSVTETSNISGDPVLTSSSTSNNQWYLNGVVIPGATSQTYTPTQSGVYYVAVTQGPTTVTSFPKTVVVPVTITQNGNVLTSSSSTGNTWYLNGVLLPQTTQSITITEPGIYQVVVTTNGVSSDASINIAVLGINQSTISDAISVSPNPNNGTFTLIFNRSNISTYKVEIVDMEGQIVYSETLANFSGSYVKQISLNNAKGVYVVNVTDSKSRTTTKIIVQ